MDELILRNLPELAALNKWTKYKEPSRKICLAIGFYGTLLFIKAFQLLADESQDKDDDRLFRELLAQAQAVAGNVHEEGPPDNTEFRRLKRTCFTYAASFRL